MTAIHHKFNISGSGKSLNTTNKVHNIPSLSHDKMMEDLYTKNVCILEQNLNVFELNYWVGHINKASGLKGLISFMIYEDFFIKRCISCQLMTFN